ncbi:MAG: response regulator, partial [Deltaproteobacteria bacterium]|nr:response regulator [Deltaproteobacteria bacterium]
MVQPNHDEQPYGEILVIEDNPDSLKLLVGILTETGYSVRPAASGGLGLRSMQAKAPDLVLLDFKLPDINGIEVCRRIKANPDLRDIPIIFISALEESAMKVKALRTGAVDYVTKPINTDEVLARIATHLNISRLQQKLARQATELEEHRRNLQQLVAERTGELEASEKKFRSLFETSVDGIMVIDAETMMIVDVNPSCERIYGYSR